MKKLKMFGLSLVASVSFGMVGHAANVNAMEVETSPTEVVPASSTYFHTQYFAATSYYINKNAIWVSKVVNGKEYSGYIYNRGIEPNGKTVKFTGTLKTGPHGETLKTQNKK